MPPQLNGIKCYTNGGKSKHRIGWGYCIHDHLVTYDAHRLLGQTATSFQAEIHAIMQAARSLSLRNDENIYFLISNLSIAQVLERRNAQRLMVQECIDTHKCLA